MKTTTAFELLCKATKKWGLYLYTSEPDGFEGDFIAELHKATLLPDLALPENAGAGEYYTSDLFYLELEGEIILLFDTEEECYAVYENIVGDDGPTKTNPYDGPVRVYACTYDPKGQGRSENT